LIIGLFSILDFSTAESINSPSDCYLSISGTSNPEIYIDYRQRDFSKKKQMEKEKESEQTFRNGIGHADIQQDVFYDRIVSFLMYE